MTRFDENFGTAGAVSSLAARSAARQPVLGKRLRPARAWVALVLWLAVALLPSIGRATCTYYSGIMPAVIGYSPPTPITVPYNAPVGYVLYTSNPVGPNGTSQMNCTGSSAFGITNLVGSQPPTYSGTIFPTSVPGLGYRLGPSGGYLPAYGGAYAPQKNWVNDPSTTIVLTLVKTSSGPITNGSVLPSGNLAYWTFENNINIDQFVLNNSVTILSPACSVVATPINVILPTVSSTSLKAVGATSGGTRFNIQLNCFAGAKVAITFNYNGPNTGIPGVLANTGTAGGVGVQLDDGNGNGNGNNQTAVAFGNTKIVATNTSDGVISLPYYAWYYRTAAVTPGTVAASATFTLSYP